MRLDISHSFSPEERRQLAELIRYGVHHGSDDDHAYVLVRVKRDRSGRGHRGYAYHTNQHPFNARTPRSTRNLITLTVPSPLEPGEIVSLAAHEGRHVADFRARAPWKGREKRANATGRRVARQWLREQRAAANTYERETTR